MVQLPQRIGRVVLAAGFAMLWVVPGWAAAQIPPAPLATKEGITAAQNQTAPAPNDVAAAPKPAPKTDAAPKPKQAAARTKRTSAPKRDTAPAPDQGSVDADSAQLDALRGQCVAAAATVRKNERTVGALDLAVAVMTRAVAAKQQEVAQSRHEQEQLLGALARLAKAPAEALALSPEGPIERVRSGVLIAAAVPALTDQARSLSGQVASMNVVRDRITARRRDVDDARAALTKSRDALLQLVVKRNGLDSKLLSGDGAAGMAKLGEQASDLFELISRAEGEIERRDKELLIRIRTSAQAPKGALPVLDPSKPKTVRSLETPQTSMVWPVIGEIARRFGDADTFNRPNQGVTLDVLPAGLVVAPFDGRVEYAGVFRGYGLILIIRHGGGYHSVLAGMARVDTTIGQWVLAGEPVGTVADADGKNASATFYFELRHDGRPIDPQSRLASRDEKSEESR